MSSRKQVFYIHGGCAFSQYEDYLKYLDAKKPEPFKTEHNRWNKRLAEDVGSEYEVFMPEMPNKFNAQYEEWKIWFENHHQFLRDEVVLIGYSMGAMFYLKYLTNNDLPFTIKKLILIACPYGYFKDEVTGEDGGSLNITEQEDISVIANKVQSITLYHSKDDFAVPYDCAPRIQEKLPNAELVSFEDRNHFLVEDFPELLKEIRQIG